MPLLGVCLDDGFRARAAAAATFFKLVAAEEGSAVSASRKCLRCTDVCTEPEQTASDVCLHYTDSSTSLSPQIHFGLR